MYFKYPLLMLALLILAGCSTHQSPALDHAEPDADAVTEASADTGATISPDAPAGKLDPSVQPIRYRLNLTILPDLSSYSGSVDIDLKIQQPLEQIFLHGKDLDVSKVILTTYDEIEYSGKYEQVHSTGVAMITFDTQIPAGTARLQLRYTAKFPRGAQGLYHSTVADDSYAFTQFQPISARRLFPGFDEPLFKTPYDISVTTYDDNVVISNTAVKKRTRLGKGLTRFDFATTRPLPSYLLAFAVGPLDVVDWQLVATNSVRDRPIPLRGIATRGNGPNMRFALENTAPIIDYLEEYFDVPFPYPKLDLISSPDFGGAAMENAGAVIYGDALILLTENAPLQQQRKLGSVHAHELAHHWFGNLVTPKWWDDIWLNESFATWMGNKSADAWRPELKIGMDSLVEALNTMRLDSQVSARQIRQPIETSMQIASSFDSITYRKGAGVLSMFESYLGEDEFRAGIRLHMKRFEHGVADVEDFMSSLAEGSKRPDVVPAFRSFIDQPGVPVISVALNCEANHSSLLVSQARYLPAGSKGNPDQIWQIPLCIRSGVNGVAEKQCTLLTEKVSEILLEQDECPDYVMPNADGAGYYRFALENSGWTDLVNHFSELSEKEALSFADSLSAAYRADRISTRDYLKAIDVIVRSESRLVAMAPGRDLIMIHDNLSTTADTRKRVRQLMQRYYQPRLDALAASSAEEEDAVTADDLLAKTELISFLALQADSQTIRSRLAEQAKLYLRFAQEQNGLDESAIAPSLIDAALRSGMLEFGMPFMDVLSQRLLSSEDSRFRSQASTALGYTDDRAVAAQVRILALDERLRSREMSNMINALARRATQRQQTFDWFKLNIDAYLGRMPSFTHRWQSGLARGFCTQEDRDDVMAFFEPRVKEIQGGERSLASVIEEIELCVALSNARSEEVDEYFAKLR